ncbi:MAG: phenylacetate--CoA ligase family protein [Anaerolineaceae bacterium]|nr:phenylacetate--CoA ligase family protein [Anaerolineaceae bacterium]NTV35548.1 phenylacetate--CoA ligase family protein [Anaerolineaceae bacterium]
MKISPLQAWIGTKIGRDDGNYDRNMLERYQLYRLQQVIGEVKEKSLFYRQLFAQSTHLPATLHDLAQFPFTTPQDIQQDPNRFICVPQDAIQRIVTLPTSGTTGRSKRVFFTPADQELTIDFFQVGMSTLADRRDRVLILLPGQRPGSVGDLLRMGLERLGCIPFPHGPDDDEDSVLKLIRNQNINVMVGSPVQIHRLARWDETYKILPAGQIKSVLTSTDYLADVIAFNLKKIWGCEVFDHYGMTETGLGGGVECEAHQGYHLREADLYFEVVDPETGTPVADGEMGELVVTTLTRTGMPLIRYRTGDISRFLPGMCACGSFIKRLEKIKTRSHAGIHLRSGEFFRSNLEEALFQINGVMDFSAQFENCSDHDELTLAVRFIKRPLEEISVSVLDGIQKILAFQTELANGTLRVIISEMEKAAPAPTGTMVKRVITVKISTVC